MGDVEDQLRAYGDSIGDGLPDDLATVSAAPRRHALVLASAALVVTVALVGALLVARDARRDRSAVRTVTSVAVTGRPGPKVTAELHLDKNVVHRGEDVTGIVVFDNRSGAPYSGDSLRFGSCGSRWTVAFNRPSVRSSTFPSQCEPPTPSDQPIGTLSPGRTSFRFVLQTVSGSCRDAGNLWCPFDRAHPDARTPMPPQHTRVWFVVPVFSIGSPQPVTITKRAANPPYCTSRDVTAHDAGPASAPGASESESAHEFFLIATHRRPCQLDGAPGVAVGDASGSPIVEYAGPSEVKETPLGSRRVVIAQRGRVGGVGVLVRVTRAANVEAKCVGGLRVQFLLPDQGGIVPAKSNLDQLCVTSLRVVSGFRPLRPSKRAPTHRP